MSGEGEASGASPPRGTGGTRAPSGGLAGLAPALIAAGLGAAIARRPPQP